MTVGTSFKGLLAVVTGGGTGMGRELALQLTAEGCSVAMCDVSADNMAITEELCRATMPAGTTVSSFVADVSSEQQLVAFREHVVRTHCPDSPALHLLFNNAGVGGGGSFIDDDRSNWESTFNVCWGGVYLGCRTFMPLLLAAEKGHVVNTSSVNGFWASLGPGVPHTAYSAAKFAVKGFTEALITDFRVNAPHLSASVVMPGHIGTDIVLNSGAYHGRSPKELTEAQVAEERVRLAKRGLDVSGASDDDIRLGLQMMGEGFRDTAPTSAAQAATIILDGVRRGDWRILVGADAVSLDEVVRENPTIAYDPEFNDILQARRLFQFAADPE